MRYGVLSSGRKSGENAEDERKLQSNERRERTALLSARKSGALVEESAPIHERVSAF